MDLKNQMRYFEENHKDDSRKEITREEFVEKVSAGRNVSAIIKFLETGGGTNHSNRYPTKFFTYEVERCKCPTGYHDMFVECRGY